MKTYTEPHQVKDIDKLASLIEAYRTNQAITPIVVQGELAFTGSHRIAAHRQAWKLWNTEADGWEDASEPELESVEIDDETWHRACTLRGVDHLDELGDWNDLCSALYDASDDEDVKSALEDQRG